MAPVNDSYPGTRLRAFRISDELYSAVRDKAQAQGDTLTEIVRAAFAAYLAVDTSTQDRGSGVGERP